MGSVTHLGSSVSAIFIVAPITLHPSIGRIRLPCQRVVQHERLRVPSQRPRTPRPQARCSLSFGIADVVVRPALGRPRHERWRSAVVLFGHIKLITASRCLICCDKCCPMAFFQNRFFAIETRGVMQWKCIKFAISSESRGRLISPARQRSATSHSRRLLAR